MTTLLALSPAHDALRVIAFPIPSPTLSLHSFYHYLIYTYQFEFLFLHSSFFSHQFCLLTPMFFIEDLLPLLQQLVGNTRLFSEKESHFHNQTESMRDSACGGTEAELCRDDSAAFILKFVAIASILLAGMAGIAIPLIGKHRRFLRTDGNLFVTAKAFAAGVILATGFVHMLSDATESLNSPCLPEFPWSKFPFTGFFAMMAALFTLLLDFVGTQYYERKQGLNRATEEQVRVGSSEQGIVDWSSGNKVFGEEESGGMHIVGMHAHAAHHRHSHPQGHDACHGIGTVKEHGHAHGHAHGIALTDEEETDVRHVVVSQVLELGIVSHSVIIGLSLGVSQSPCTIRPLIAALSFHQFFEGFALGGCISQAQFKASSATIMACFFCTDYPCGCWDWNGYCFGV